MALSEDIADVVEDIKPAVVFIAAEIEARDFFNRVITRTATGSGVIISADGYILTNNHVVEDAIKLEVMLPSVRRTFEAELVGTDPLTDLAVIQIEGMDFPTASFGDASRLRPGNLVLAIGNPLGLEGGPSITLGVISNLDRSLERIESSTFYDVIQTDAAINPGNSGGPLVNLNGEVIGINSVMAGGAENIGFAISVNTAQPVYESLIAPPHRVIRPWLGVGLSTVTPDLADELDLSRLDGVTILEVYEDSPAEEAGLEVGDVITRINGTEVNVDTQLIKLLWKLSVDEPIEVTFWRGNEEMFTSVTPVERPPVE